MSDRTVADYQETNRRFHRRVQALEGPLQSKLDKMHDSMQHWIRRFDEADRTIIRRERQMIFLWLAIVGLSIALTATALMRHT